MDFERRLLRFEESKTGRKTVALGAAALALLSDLRREAGNPYVITGKKAGAGSGVWVGFADGSALSRCPQASQKLRSVGLARLHPGQINSAASESPHLPQKVAPSRFSWPQDGQSIAIWPVRRLSIHSSTLGA